MTVADLKQHIANLESTELNQREHAKNKLVEAEHTAKLLVEARKELAAAEKAKK